MDTDKTPLSPKDIKKLKPTLKVASIFFILVSLPTFLLTAYSYKVLNDNLNTQSIHIVLFPVLACVGFEYLLFDNILKRSLIDTYSGKKHSLSGVIIQKTKKGNKLTPIWPSRKVNYSIIKFEILLDSFSKPCTIDETIAESLNTGDNVNIHYSIGSETLLSVEKLPPLLNSLNIQGKNTSLKPLN